MGDLPMDSDSLVRDYLARLDDAAAALPVDRRAELVEEVRAHIDSALRESGGHDEATVRNVLDRLGSPEEIAASDGERPATANGPRSSVAADAGAGPRRALGALE